MINFTVPGYKTYSLHHLVLDYNGTLAQDGQILADIPTTLNKVSENLKLHIITADTFGKAQLGIKGIHCELSILNDTNQAEAKQRYIQMLGSNHTAAIGNGRNDRLMLKEASLGIAVLGPEGTAVESVLDADIICSCISDGLELLLNPLRIVATLRS